MPASSSEKAPEASFIFKGTVKKLKAATMRNVEVNDRTAVVTVNQVIEAPKALAGYGGKDITVQLSGRQKIKVGQELIFHANPTVWGDSVAVQSVSQEPVKRTHAAMLSRGGDPVQHRADRALRQRFDGADVVLSGRVSSVRLPLDTTESQTRDRAGGADELPSRGPVSEHDPKWREAVVEVDEVHKGVHSKKNVVVRFPASTDVRWYKAPKFHPGQQGYFMLRRHKVEGGERAPTDQEPETEAYTVLDPMDFQPYSQPSGIKTLIETNPEKG
jgi:hypothetical protein